MEDRPRIDGVEWLWTAYLDLSTCRPIGMDAGPIPWTAANEYAQRHGLSGDELDELWLCIRHMDNARAEHISGKAKKADPKADPKQQAIDMVKHGHK